jgi:hypothetical protein
MLLLVHADGVPGGPECHAIRTLRLSLSLFLLGLGGSLSLGHPIHPSSEASRRIELSDSALEPFERLLQGCVDTPQ